MDVLEDVPLFPHDDLRLFQPAALMRDTVLIESDRPHPASLHLHPLPTHKACQCLPSMFVCSIPRCIPHPIGTITWVLIPMHPNWHRFPHDANGVKRNISNLNQRLLKKVTDRGKCILLHEPLALCYIHNDDDDDDDEDDYYDYDCNYDYDTTGATFNKTCMTELRQSYVHTARK